MANKRFANQPFSYSQSQKLRNLRTSFRQRSVVFVALAFMFLGGYMIVSSLWSSTAGANQYGFTFFGKKVTLPWQKKTSEASKNNSTLTVSGSNKGGGAPGNASPASKQTPGTVVVDDPVMPGKPGVIDNGMCWVDYSQDLSMKIKAEKLLANCKNIFPRVEQQLSSSIYRSPYIIILGKLADDYSFSYLPPNFKTGEKLCEGAIGCVFYWDRAAAYLDIDTVRTFSDSSNTRLLSHEITHMVQSYKSYGTPQYPKWLVEGMADYVPQVLGVDRTSSCFDVDYSSGYDCGAAFLKYLTKHDKNIVKKLHTALRNDTYSDELLKSITGKTIFQLYNDCLNTDCKGGRPLVNNKPMYDSGGPPRSLISSSTLSGGSRSNSNSKAKKALCPKTTGVTALGEFMYTRLMGFIGR